MRPTLTQILDEVLLANEMSKEYYEENKKSRMRKIVTIRQVFSLVGQDYGYTQCQIGGFLGLDHSSIHYNKKIAKQYCDCEKEYSAMVTKVFARLKARFPIHDTHAMEGHCCDCEVFKNYQGKKFMLGFHCPIMNMYVCRNEFACEFALSDEMIF